MRTQDTVFLHRMQLKLIVTTLVVIVATTTALPVQQAQPARKVRQAQPARQAQQSETARHAFWLSLTTSLYDMQREILTNLLPSISVSFKIEVDSTCLTNNIIYFTADHSYS